MTSKKQVMASINKLDNKLLTLKKRISKEKHYFRHIFQTNKIVISSVLLSAFLIGWKSTNYPAANMRLKQFSKFMFLTVVSHFKNKFI